MTPTAPPARRPNRRVKRRDDRGQVTVYMIGFSLAILLLGVGGTVETWRIVSTWRSLAATADAAAAAGASGLDEPAFRASGGQTVQLDPATAERLAYQSIDTQTDRAHITDAQADATTEQITVTVRAEVDLLILDTLRGGQPFTFTATATADPRAAP